jgi:hypothetical protein
MFRPGDGGERDDMDFLAILTKLDQIHALRVIKKILKNKNPYNYAESGFQSIALLGIPEFIARLLIRNVKAIEGKKVNMWPEII